jgi:hypothetical protein
VRLGYGIPTVHHSVDPSGNDFETVSKDWRVFEPISLNLGYRGKWEAWGLEAIFGLVIGENRTGINDNLLGGHTDYGGNLNFALHFLRYMNPRGLMSWYLGAGGTFEVMWFYQINSNQDRGQGDRSTMVSGGFDIDLLAGIEFMRASRVQFFLQAALMLPIYLIEGGQGAYGKFSTYLPGVGLTLGMLF